MACNEVSAPGPDSGPALAPGHSVAGRFYILLTGSGDVTAEGTQTGSWEIRTGSGNVHVRLPANAAFDADISTSSGSVDVGEPIEMTVQGRVGDTHKQIHGKVHGGGPLLRVRTGSGDIHIQ